MDFLNKALAIIKEKNDGEDLDINKNEYHLFMKDAHVLIYLDDETKTIKVEVEMFDEGRAKIYFSDLELEEIM